jgi:hypothetical protein
LLLHLLHGRQGLPNCLNCLRNICSIVIGVVVMETAVVVSHPMGLAALVGHASRLAAYFQTSVESIHTSELTL